MWPKVTQLQNVLISGIDSNITVALMLLWFSKSSWTYKLEIQIKHTKIELLYLQQIHVG